MQEHTTISWSPEKRHIHDLTPAAYNPRTMTSTEKQDIINSINGFGHVVPLVINTGSRKNVVIGGHQRLKIYLEQSVENIDVMVPSRELTLDEEQELNLRLNKNTGSWDMDLLGDLNLDLLVDVGFGDDELQDFFDDVELSDDDYDVEKARKETIEPTVSVDEVWQLGEHRLLVGDSTNVDLVTEFMHDVKADVVLCDPPYNIGLDYGTGIGAGNNYGGNYSKQDDSKSTSGYAEFLNNSIKTALSVSKPDAHVFYWCDAQYIGVLQDIYNKHDISFKRLCHWIKNNQNPTPQVAFNKVCEPCVYGTVGRPHLNKNFKNANEIMNQEVTSGNQLHDEILEMLDLWIVRRDNTKEYLHPTQKPVGLSEKPLRRCSAPGHIVFSGFGGSGSDLIACEQLNRRWYGVEQDPLFATVIIDRWETFTGKTAKRL